MNVTSTAGDAFSNQELHEAILQHIEITKIHYQNEFYFQIVIVIAIALCFGGICGLIISRYLKHE